MILAATPVLAALHGFILLLAGTALLTWLLLGLGLRLARGASLRFALGNALLGLGVLGAASREAGGALPPWLLWQGADLAVLLSFSLLRSGLCRLYRQPWRWRQDLLLLSLALAGYALLQPGAADLRAFTTLFSAVAAALALLLAWDVWTALLQAFRRRRVAALLALPFAGAAAVMLARLAPLEGQAVQPVLDPVGSLWAFAVLTLVLNACMVAAVLARLLQVMAERAATDPLTGLLNRRAFDAQLQREAARSQRQGGVYALLLIDLDHFKRLNDELGHAAGDEALREAAARLRSGLREMDSLARYGGEEFVALLPGCSPAQALALAERLRIALQQPDCWIRGERRRLSASLGLAHSSQLPRGVNPAQLLERADAALYQAKQAGRNQVRVA